MANTIEVIIKATDQASTVIDKVEANTVSSSAAIVKGLDNVGTAAGAVDKKLEEYGAALADVTSEQNKLKQAQSDAQDTAEKLANTQKGLTENTTASSAAMVKGFDGVGTAAGAVDKKLGEYGAALDDVTREQNKLKQAQYDAQDAAQKLAKAQKDLAENTDPKRTEELNHALADAQVKLDKAGQEVQKLSQNLREGKSATEGASGAWTKMQAGIVTANQALELVGRGFQTVKGIVEDVVGGTMAYSKQVRELSTNLGISAEETSKIIQASDDYGISVETVTGALQMAVKRGFAPSIENLAKLADEYNSISDPIQRAARLSDVFGRGWTSLTPILSAGGKAIRDAAAEAEKLGLVLSDKDVQGARALEISVDNLNDRIDALKLKMGKDLVPVAVNVADVLTKFTDIVQGTESPLDAMNRQLEYMKSFYGEASPQVIQATKAIADYKQMLIDVAMTSDEKTLRSNMNLLNSFGKMQTSVSDLERGIRNQAGVYAVLDAAMDKTTAKSNLLASSQAIIAGEMADLKTAMAGAIKNEEKQYSDSQTELQKRLKETADELKNLEGAQGSVDKSTVKNAMSAAELTKAHVDLAAAQARLAKETDPMKQQQLAASIGVQQEKLAGANQAVVTYVDNSKRIAELKGQYDDINKEIAANAAEHEKATRTILFGYAEQAIAQANAKAGIVGMTETQQKALDALAVRWGLKSEEDVKAMQAIREAGIELAKDGSINEFVGKVDRAAGEAGTSFNAIAGSADNARKAIAKAGVPVEIPITPKTDTASQTAFNNAAKNYVTNAVPVPLTPKTDPAAQTAFQNTAQGYITHPVEVPVNAKAGTVDAKTAIGAAGIPIDVPVTPKLTPGAGEGVSNQVKGFFPGGIPLPIVPKIDPADRTKIGHDLLGDLKFAKPTIKPELDYTKVKQDFSKFFNLPDVKKVQEPLVMAIKADTSSAITSMQYFSSYGLSPAITYYDALIARASLFSTIVGLTPALPTLPGTPTTTTPTTTTPTRPPGAGPAEFATGADFIVPPGYPGDSFPMRVSSGERVQVTPAGQGGGGNLPPINITQTFNGAQSSPEQYRSIMYEVITDVFDKAMHQ